MYDELYFESSPRCERCGDYDCVRDNAIFCDRCTALEEMEEEAFPSPAPIPLITSRPVPGPTFDEVRRVLEKL
jgi:hypothetical protein